MKPRCSGLAPLSRDEQLGNLAQHGQALFSFGSSVCHIRVLRAADGSKLILASDLTVRMGPSIVNGVEELAEELARRVCMDGAFHLVLCDSDVDLSAYRQPMHYTLVAFGRPSSWENPDFMGLDRRSLSNLVGHKTDITVPHLTTSERDWIAAKETQDQRRAEQATIERRAAIQIVWLADLPPTVVTAKREAQQQDWPAIGAAACKIYRSKVDPLDLKAVLAAHPARGLRGPTHHGLASLFANPIVASPRGYTNGRHRTQAMRDVGVLECVIELGGEDFAGPRPPASRLWLG